MQVFVPHADHPLTMHRLQFLQTPGSRTQDSTQPERAMLIVSAGIPPPVPHLCSARGPRPRGRPLDTCQLPWRTLTPLARPARARTDRDAEKKYPPYPGFRPPHGLRKPRPAAPAPGRMRLAEEPADSKARTMSIQTKGAGSLRSGVRVAARPAMFASWLRTQKQHG